MNLDFNIAARTVAPIVTLVLGAVIRYYMGGRAALVSYIGHISGFTLPDGTNVFAHSVIVKNTGRRAAHNVRLSHHVFPPSVSIYPPVQYSIETNPEGQQDIVIPTLVPAEQVTVSYLYFPPITWENINVTTKCDEGFAKIITTIPVEPASKATRLLLSLLMFIGASTTVYWLLWLAVWV